MSPDGSELASLIVIQFKFQPRKIKNRFKSAKIELCFEDLLGQRDNDPKVFAISPDGRYMLVYLMKICSP
jgi:hypothetical protein